MSTLRKLTGKQFDNMREQRKAALSFYRQMAVAMGPAGKVAATIYEGLLRVHKDPTLNAYEKDREFRRLVRAVQHSADSVAVAK